MRSYEGLLAWQKAIDLVEQVYQASRGWPQEEEFGLRNQIRRAAVSVPSNIAEGRGRTGSSEYLHHLSIAHGSLYEVGTQIVITQRLKYLDEATSRALKDQIDEVGRLIGGLIRRLRKAQSPTSPVSPYVLRLTGRCPWPTSARTCCAGCSFSYQC